MDPFFGVLEKGRELKSSRISRRRKSAALSLAAMIVLAATSIVFLAIIAEYPAEFTFRPGIDNIGRSQFQFRIHPHVKRPFMHKAEASQRLIELHGRNAKIN